MIFSHSVDALRVFFALIDGGDTQTIIPVIKVI